MCKILLRRSPRPVLRHNIDGLVACQPQAVEMIRFGYIVFRVRVVEAAVGAAEAYPYVVEGGILGGGRQRELVAAQGGDVVGGGDGGLLGL